MNNNEYKKQRKTIKDMINPSPVRNSVFKVYSPRHRMCKTTAFQDKRQQLFKIKRIAMALRKNDTISELEQSKKIITGRERV